MSALTVLLLGAIISGATQLGKTFLPSINPLLIVAMLAILGGVIHGAIIPLIPVNTIELIGTCFASAVGFYEILKSVKGVK